MLTLTMVNEHHCGTDMLFVYGSLRRQSGHAMSRWLMKHAEWQGEGAITGRLFRVDWYPGLVAGQGLVKGDVYRLPTPAMLERLDAFEDIRGRPDDEYERRLSAVQMIAGGSLQAWVYWYRQSTERLELVQGGDWLLAGAETKKP